MNARGFSEPRVVGKESTYLVFDELANQLIEKAGRSLGWRYLKLVLIAQLLENDLGLCVNKKACVTGNRA